MLSCIIAARALFLSFYVPSDMRQSSVYQYFTIVSYSFSFTLFTTLKAPLSSSLSSSSPSSFSSSSNSTYSLLNVGGRVLPELRHATQGSVSVQKGDKRKRSSTIYLMAFIQIHLQKLTLNYKLSENLIVP